MFFGRFSIGQILIILAIFTALFGYKKLPGLGKSLGKALRDFRRSVDEPDEIDITPGKAEKSGETKSS